MCDKLHAPAVLPRGKEPQIPTEQAAEEPHSWSGHFKERRNLFAPAENRLLYSSSQETREHPTYQHTEQYALTGATIYS
jgi:hypothetical protein